MPYIKVSFYDGKHQNLLKSTPKYGEIENLVNNGLTCSNEDLWTYGIFREQKNISGFQNFQALKAKLPKRLSHIEDYFNLDNITVRAKHTGVNNQDKTLTEILGIGAALTLISEIHGLTQADWNILPERNPKGIKDLDFKIASDGNQVVYVEAKGSYVESDDKTNSIYKMKSDIGKKKEQQRNDGNTGLLYGVITSYSANPNILAHSRILDPPVVNMFSDDPRKLKLLSRLNFYLDQLNHISRSQFLSSLANRIRAVEVLQQYEALDSQFLRNQFGKKFSVPNFYNSARTTDQEEDIFGEVFPNCQEIFSFFGLEGLIIKKLIDQNFSQILEHRCNLPRAFDVTIHAKVKIKDLDEYNINYRGLKITGDNARVIMPLSGRLHSNSAGIIYGNLVR